MSAVQSDNADGSFPIWHSTLTEFARARVGGVCVLQKVTIFGRKFLVKSAKELLDTIVKVAAIRSSKKLLEAVRRFRANWIWKSKRSPWGFKYNNNGNASTAILRARCVVNWVGWSDSDIIVSYRKMHFEAEVKASKRIVRSALENGGQWFGFAEDSADELLLANSSPACLEIDGKAFVLNSWDDVLLRSLDYICDRRVDSILSAMKSKTINAWLGLTNSGMVRPRKHLCGMFVDTEGDPPTIVGRAKNLLQVCGFDLGIVRLAYRPNLVSASVVGPKVESKNVPASVTARPKQPISSLFLDEIETDIKVNCPNGFDFKETSRRLVEGRIGKAFGDAEAERLKGKMFLLANGLWLFPDMVMDCDTCRQMEGRAREWLSDYGCFAIDALRSEFESVLRNVVDRKDFEAFFDKFVAGDVCGSVRGHGDWRVCFGANTTEDVGWSAIASRIHDVLSDCGDAVPIDDIVARMPYLVRGVVVRLASERMQDVVLFVVDDIEYAKLLESYYLPEDFSETISKFVETTEAAQGVVSVVLLEAELNERYGDGFRVSYGLEDDFVFKQVVSKSFIGKNHDWNRDMFTRNGKRGESNVAEVFMKGHPDIFHEEDFFEYALESRGMKNRGMLILTFLRKHCIRLSKERWMSIDSFEAKFGMSEAQYHQIGQILNEMVGNSRFVPISSIGEDVYDRFPHLESEGKEYPWNPYLLTSVAVHKVRNARVINDDPSPYTVTAMILPYAVDKIDDVVEYVLGAFPVGYFTDVDSAFGYLKANNVRLTKTEKLVAKIKAVLGIQ